MNTDTIHNSTDTTTGAARTRSVRTRGVVAGLAGLAAVVGLAGPMAGAAGAISPHPIGPFTTTPPVVAPPTVPPTTHTIPPYVTIPPVVVADPGTGPASQPTNPPAPQPTSPPAAQPTSPTSGGSGTSGGRGQQAPTTTPQQGIDAAFGNAGIVPTAAEEARVREVADQTGRTGQTDQGGSTLIYVAGLGVVVAGAATTGVVVSKRRRQA